jgi:nitrogen fixation NifU-like protein
MPGLEDLYREIILDHYRTPRNRGELDTPPAVAVNGHNPLCGDEITVYLLLDRGVDGDGDDAIVTDIKIGGQGCSISQSSASMMSQAVRGKTVAQTRALLRRFKSMMSIDVAEQPGDDEVALGDLEALQGVVKFPVRIKCAVLGWNTLDQAINEAQTR